VECRATAWPNASLSVTLGNTTQLADRDLGYLFTIGYANSTDREIETIRNVRLQGEGDAQEIAVAEELAQETGLSRVAWNALGTLSYELAENHTLSLVSLFSHTADDRVRFVSGFSDAEGSYLQARRLQWVQRSLSFSQLLGSHRHLFWDAEIDWQLSLGVGAREEPDTRDLTYLEAPLGMQWRTAPGSGERFFSDLALLDLGAQLNYTQPFSEVLRLKLGGLGRFTDRDFSARRFRFEYTADSTDALPDPEVLFGPKHRGEHPNRRGHPAHRQVPGRPEADRRFGPSTGRWPRPAAGGAR
jgi:hypothetical protein